MLPSSDETICALCNGTGWKPVQSNGIERVTRCDCWQASNRRRMFERANIPERYRRCELETFQPHNDTAIYALRTATRFCQEFPVVEKGLLLVGRHGIGKTHLATAILKAVIRRTGARGMFWEVPKLLRKIRDTYNPVVKTTEIEVIQPIMSAELLVLDELGAEKASEWVEETMTLIINTRYSERLATIFTTNYWDVLDPDPKSLADTLLERVGSRIHSRLHEMCEFVPMEDVDRRIVGPDPTAEEMVRFDQRNRGMGPTSPISRGGRHQAKAQLRSGDGKADLKWPGGRAGSK